MYNYVYNYIIIIQSVTNEDNLVLECKYIEQEFVTNISHITL